MRAVLAAIALSVGALLLPLGASGAPNSAMTIRLLSTSVPPDLLRDLPPRGAPSKGDVIAQSSVLRNLVPQFGAPKGAVVGGDYDVATLLSAHVALSKTRVRLPGGTLRVEGREGDKPTTSGTNSVIAGTGRFAGARGTVYIRDLRPFGRRRAINVYRLRLP